jgi:hypothetical protein
MRDGSPNARRLAMTNVARLLPPPDSHLRLIMSQDERPDTIPPDTHRESPTQPHASERPLKPETLESMARDYTRTITPPPRQPDADELANSALASQNPPAWWADSFIGAALSDFSAEARRIHAEREERRRYEQEQLRLQEKILEAVERAEQTVQRAEKRSDANFEIVHAELRSLKASDMRQDGRLADGDRRFQQIEQSIADLKDELIALVTRATEDAAKRIEALEQELANARAAEATHPR